MNDKDLYNIENYDGCYNATVVLATDDLKLALIRFDREENKLYFVLKADEAARLYKILIKGKNMFGNDDVFEATHFWPHGYDWYYDTDDDTIKNDYGSLDEYEFTASIGCSEAFIEMAKLLEEWKRSKEFERGVEERMSKISDRAIKHFKEMHGIENEKED